MLSGTCEPADQRRDDLGREMEAQGLERGHQGARRRRRPDQNDTVTSSSRRMHLREWVVGLGKKGEYSGHTPAWTPRWEMKLALGGKELKGRRRTKSLQHWRSPGLREGDLCTTGSLAEEEIA